jgi:hypothetical protein
MGDRREPMGFFERICEKISDEFFALGPKHNPVFVIPAKAGDDGEKISVFIETTI